MKEKGTVFVPFSFEGPLVHVMLVLSHPNGFGIDLYEFRQGIHQTAADETAPRKETSNWGNSFLATSEAE